MHTPPLIVIFGAALAADGRASPALARRIRYGQLAADVWRDAPVLCSGGVGRFGPSEASVMIADLLAGGLPPERIDADHVSLDTLQTVLVAVRMARDEGRPFVVACSDGYHLPRIRLMLAILGVRSVSGPKGGPRGPWSHRLRMAAREVAALPYDAAIVIWRRLTGAARREA
ncbi:MAG: YdcF family protein [Phenylobacterium sp.]